MKLRDTLLLVGSAESVRPVWRDFFQGEYDLLEAGNIEQGLFLLEQNMSCIAAVIVDRPPPKKKDLSDSFLHAVQTRPHLNEIPMLAVITPSNDGRTEELAFSLGASDVVLRTAAVSVIRHRVKIMVDLFRNRQHLLTLSSRQAEKIRHTNEVMVDALSSIIEYRSAESGSHILRIRRFTEILLEEVARSCPEYALTPEDIKNISSAAALHDIGKISIPDQILNKPGKLTDDEMEIMKAHTTNGANMIQTLSGVTSEAYLRYAYNICRYHHEQWTGGGYPDGLMGDDIPICAQVVSIADVFDALTTDRVYKKAYSPSAAINMILNGESSRFSQKLLSCFKRVLPQYVELAQDYAGGRSPKNDSIALPLPSPVYSNVEIGSLQAAQVKYQALLHYIRATVIEIDLDYSAFHVVYNPFPHFQPLPELFPLDKKLTADDLVGVHPEDMAHVLEEYEFLRGEFFSCGLRKRSFSCRMYSPLVDGYRMYRVTFLRLDIESSVQRKAILIWEPLSILPDANEKKTHTLSVQDRKASYILTSNVICRKNDGMFTLLSGQRKLLDLFGYTDTEIYEQFENHFLKIIHPDDRTAFRHHVKKASASHSLVESEYRVRHKDGHIIWILERGCIVSDDENQEYFYGSLMDNSHSHLIQDELAAAMRRNQLIIDQSDDIIFDWDIVNQQVSLSGKWNEVFGYDPPMIATSSMLPLSKVHPDDFPALIHLGECVHSGAPHQETELRIANSENHYVWCRLRLTSLRNAQGITYRAVGTLTNIDSTKRAYLSLQAQAQQDPLTGLLNKVSTKDTIHSYLESRLEPHGALLMIDLDNFKGINDNYGHFFGDTVLIRVAKAIRRLFRSEDVLGRVGGDEFMVFMKDARNLELVSLRCSLLIDELSRLFQEEEATGAVKLKIGCSIGVALAPEHGTSFKELFQRADQALYYSKQSGKNSYSIYREDLEISSSLISTPIDSNTRPSLIGSNLVRDVFHKLAHTNNLEKAIHDVMAMVGQQTNVSRVYIFENNDANTHCSNTFEWCNAGIAPEIDNLQNISYETDIPGWEGNYNEDGILFCSDISQLSPEAYAILEPQGVKSLLHCAIYENGIFRGYIGLDECSANRIWTQEQIDILTFLGEIVVSFLLKKRTQDKVAAMSANLHNILSIQHQWFYVIEPSNYRLLYNSKSVSRGELTSRSGTYCYETIKGRTSPCDECPISKRNCQGHARCFVEDPRHTKPVLVDVNNIQWNGQDACLLSFLAQEE